MARARAGGGRPRPGGDVKKINVFEKTTRRLDSFQQRHKVPAIIVGVIKKFGDDNAGVLVVNLAYAGFVAIFPLLLVLVTILNLVLSGDPGARHAVLNSTLAQFPIIGKQLGGNIHSLQRGSTIGLVIGLVVLCYGTTGLAQAGLFSMSQVWNLPGPERPNFWKRLVRAFGFIGVLAVGLVVTTFLASFGTFGRHNLVLGLAGELVAGLVNAGLFFLAVRVLTPKVVETKSLWPGAVMGGVLWTILQAVGGYLIGHQLRNDSAIYGLFAIVLGLLAWVYLGAKVTIYSAEL